MCGHLRFAWAGWSFHDAADARQLKLIARPHEAGQVWFDDHWEPHRDFPGGEAEAFRAADRDRADFENREVIR